MEKKITNEEIMAALEIMDKKLNIIVNVMLKANEELTKEGVVKENA